MFFQRISRFLVVIIVGAVFASSPLGYAQDIRKVWERTDGLFKDQGNGVWVETDRLGTVLNKITEVDRTSDYVELYDSPRGYAVRLYSDAIHEFAALFPMGVAADHLVVVEDFV
jgi:hypothetical protein